MKEIEVQSTEDLKMLIVVGEKQRTVASTVMNTNRCTYTYANGYKDFSSAAYTIDTRNIISMHTLIVFIQYHYIHVCTI